MVKKLKRQLVGNITLSDLNQLKVSYEVTYTLVFIKNNILKINYIVF